MAEIKNAGRQSPLVAEVEFTFADLVTAVAKAAADLAVGAIVTGGFIVIDTAWNTTGAATVDVGDAGDGARYANDVNLKAAARTALTLTGRKLTAQEIVNLLPTLADTAATQGAGRLYIEYVLSGRATEAA